MKKNLKIGTFKFLKNEIYGEIMSYKFFNKVFIILTIIPFFWLFYYSLGISALNRRDQIWNEMVYLTNDSVLKNILGILVSLVGVKFIQWIINLKGNKDQSQKINKIQRIDYYMLLVSVIIMTAFSFYWIFACKAAPFADQLFVWSYANAFNNGDYSALQKGGYMSIFRHQLGLVTVFRFLFWITKNDNYLVVQLFNAAVIPVIIASGFGITRIISKNSRTAVYLYLLAMVVCFPLYGYVPFVYGEISSIAFGMLGAYLLMSTYEKFHFVKVIGMSLSLGFSVILRQNSLILIIACCVVLLVHIICEKGKNKLPSVWMLTAVLAGVGLFQEGINLGYADKIPADSKKIPAILYIAMGTNDEVEWWKDVGWYNGYNLITFDESNHNPSVASEAARVVISDYVRDRLNNPDKLLNDFFRKMNTQWNAPMYQVLVMNGRIEGEQSKLASMIYFRILGARLTKLMDLYQSVLYFGVVVFLICSFKNDRKDFYVLLLLVTCFGGFWFTFIWEAKARYILPYLIFMIPYAVCGLVALDKKIDKKCIKNWLD